MRAIAVYSSVDDRPFTAQRASVRGWRRGVPRVRSRLAPAGVAVAARRRRRRDDAIAAALPARAAERRARRPARTSSSGANQIGQRRRVKRGT